MLLAFPQSPEHEALMAPYTCGGVALPCRLFAGESIIERVLRSLMDLESKLLRASLRDAKERLSAVVKGLSGLSTVKR